MSIKFEKYNTLEFNIVKDVFEEYPLMEPYLAYIVEEYLYTTVRKYFNNGQLYFEYRVKEGNRDGEYKEWFPNGQLYTQCYYKEGKLEGENKRWYPKGQLMEQCYYKEGKYEGEYKRWYDKKNKLSLQYYYKEGEFKNGKSWNENGKLICEY